MHALLAHALLPNALLPIPGARGQAAHIRTVAKCPVAQCPVAHTCCPMPGCPYMPCCPMPCWPMPCWPYIPCCLQCRHAHISGTVAVQLGCIIPSWAGCMSLLPAAWSDTEHCKTAGELCCTVPSWAGHIFPAPHDLPGLQQVRWAAQSCRDSGGHKGTSLIAIHRNSVFRADPGCLCCYKAACVKESACRRLPYAQMEMLAD